MIQFSEQQTKVTMWAIVAAVILGLFLYIRNKIPNNTQAAQNTLDSTLGPSGVPVLPQFQYGQQGPFQVNLSDYNVPVPGFHYSGNTSIYMPMFGLVASGGQPI